MAPKLLGDSMSQPFRSCVLLCRAAGIDVEVVDVQIAKGQHLKQEYLALNPLGKVPCLQDGDLVVVESPSIMRYLCETRPVADHWLPRDPRLRARVSSACDWHLNNLRIGSMITVFNTVLYRNLGVPGNAQLVKDYGLPMLKRSLKALEQVWLASGRDYVGGGTQPSIADLLMACEIEQLRLMDAADAGPGFEELLAPHPTVRAWLGRVAAATAPHYEAVHSVLLKVRGRMVARKQQQQGQAGSKL